MNKTKSDEKLTSNADVKKTATSVQESDAEAKKSALKSKALADVKKSALEEKSSADVKKVAVKAKSLAGDKTTGASATKLTVAQASGASANKTGTSAKKPSVAQASGASASKTGASATKLALAQASDASAKKSAVNPQNQNQNQKEHGALTNDNHKALWSGRFAEGPDAVAVEFETSIYVDERMALDDIHGSIAHAKMLGDTKIISKSESKQIIDGLKSIEKDLSSGLLKIDYSAEDIHSFIEATLTDRIGEAGKKLHTGRSRNDQIALDERLYLKRVIPLLQNELITSIEALVLIASKNQHSLLSGYTHMQHAQPGTLAQHLLAWATMFKRDWLRLEDSLSRINLSPLGSGALQGSTLPLDRVAVAKTLGFSGVTENSLDSSSDRDYCIEFTSDFAILQSHLSRMCEELVLWSTTEFAFVDMSEKWSTGSSIMPQKKNPDFAELIRGRTGKVYGDLINLLTMVKGLPLAYDRDLQEDKSALFDALDTVESNLKVFTAMISSCKWNLKNMALSCEGGFANATDLAEYLVRKALPFRTAHSVAAKAVRMALDAGLQKIEDLSLEELQMCSPLIQEDVYDLLTPESCVENRKTLGAPSSVSTSLQIKNMKLFCKKSRKNIKNVSC